MEMHPLVSIAIITRNRREMLRRGLLSMLSLTYANREIVVVDNGSTDGTVAMLAQEFPEVRVIAFSQNKGICARNEGIRVSRGEFILTLDDDISLVRPDTLECIVSRFLRQPNVGLITLKICDPGEAKEHSPDHWWYPVSREVYQDRAFYAASFCEAAAAFRRSVLEKSGLYFEPLFWGGEERDLSLRVLDTEADILYLGHCPVIHWGQRGLLNTQADPRHRLLVRNAILTAAIRLPWHAAAVELAPRLLWWFVRSIRHSYFRYYVLGVTSAAGSIRIIRRNRKPVRLRTLRRIRAIRKSRYWDEDVQPVVAGD